MPTMPYGYYNRFDPTKNYDEHLFISGAGLQSSELNEIQKIFSNRLESVADALFKDGDVVRDAQVVIAAGGAVTAASGAIYLRGAVRGIGTSSFTIPTTGTVTIGIRLNESVVTALEDPALLDPATGTRNYQEPGAARLKIEPVWGFGTDGGSGEFFPVYTVEEGILLAKEPPPNLDGVTQAIARYDRDSAGGSYIVSGLDVVAAADMVGGEQVYTVTEGRARVNGYGVSLATSRRLIQSVGPDLRLVSSEPHLSATASAQRIDVDRAPAANIVDVSITAEKTVTLVHGGFVGAQDPLPDASVLEILSVTQSVTTYVNNTDYKLTAGKVDWSLPGNEVATGSSYDVTYRYIVSVTPTAIDNTGFTVTGAVTGTLVLVTYNQKLPRIDRLVMDESGSMTFLYGVPAEWYPQTPAVPANLLSIATITQSWDSSRLVTSDGVRVVPMNELAALNTRIDALTGLIAQQRLEGDAHLREAGQKNGLFVDPFRDDSLRDQGAAQTGAVFDGVLTLPIAVTVASVSADITLPSAATFTLAASVEQTARTGSMKVNPYMAFDPLPARVVLTPTVDNWVNTQVTWTGAVTQMISVGTGNTASTSQTTAEMLVSRTVRNIETLRVIDINFRLEGFGPNEVLSDVKFDGLVVTPVAV